MLLSESMTQNTISAHSFENPSAGPQWVDFQTWAYLCSHHLNFSLERFLQHQRDLLQGQTLRDLVHQVSSLLPESVENLIYKIKKLPPEFKITFPGCEDYPTQMLALRDPPLFLMYLGNPIWKKHPQFLSCVGSRNPNPYSLQWLDQTLQEALPKIPFIVVSGGAVGVDQLAHQLALRNQLPTVVILPSGLDVLYPNSLESLREIILQHDGVFLTEYGPKTAMRKYHFARRNRLIAALGHLTVIVEAKIKSGTLITAREAIELGRPLLVMPANPWDRNSQGSLKLLSEGASLLRDAQDLIMYLKSETQYMLKS